MIEGGVAGGSAQSLAAERRANAERLLSEATRLETIATDERWMANQLAELPASYTILHDLTLPGGRGKVDHVVVGPGGAFLVLTRRVDGPLSFQHDQLFAGPTSLKPALDGARVEAQALTQSLGTPVVPIIGLLGTVVQESIPGAIEGVLVTAAEQMARVVSRGSHTLLPSTKVTEVADRAMPLLATPGARPRGGPVAAVPSPPPLPAAALAAASAPDVPSPGPAPKEKKPERTAHQQHTRRFTIAVAASACLVAFAGGALLRTLFADGHGEAAPAVITPQASTTTLPVVAPVSVAPTTTDKTKAPVAKVPAPKVAFMPVCPAPGKGWSLVPAWPGKVKSLDHYEVEVLGTDGKWATVTTFKSANTVSAAIPAQGPNTTITVRITAVLSGGRRSPATSTPVITPATSC